MNNSSADQEPEPSPPSFGLSPRQRRLRVTTAILLGAVASMIAFASFHPFFRFHHVAPVTKQIKNAIALKALLILGYWTVCFGLVLAMLVVAWLDIREVRQRLAQAERDILRNITPRPGPGSGQDGQG